MTPTQLVSGRAKIQVQVTPTTTVESNCYYSFHMGTTIDSLTSRGARRSQRDGHTYPAQRDIRHVNVSVHFFIEFWAQEALRAGAFGHSKIDENSVSYDSGEYA